MPHTAPSARTLPHGKRAGGGGVFCVGRRTSAFVVFVRGACPLGEPRPERVGTRACFSFEALLLVDASDRSTLLAHAPRIAILRKTKAQHKGVGKRIRLVRNNLNPVTLRARTRDVKNAPSTRALLVRERGGRGGERGEAMHVDLPRGSNPGAGLSAYQGRWGWCECTSRVFGCLVDRSCG